MVFAGEAEVERERRASPLSPSLVIMGFTGLVSGGW